MAFWLITVAPPTCVLILLFAVTGFRRNGVVALLALIVAVWWFAGWAIFLVEPRWYGPQWFRERQRDPRMDRTTASAQALTSKVPAGSNSEARARDERLPAEPTSRRRVLFVDPALGRASALHAEGTAAGYLLIYPDELVFVADRGDDALRPGPTIRAIPASSITGLRLGRGMRVVKGKVRQGEVHVHTESGRGWIVEPLRRDSTVDDLRRAYVDGRGPSP